MGSACDKTSPSTALLTQAANKTWKQSSFDHNTLLCCSTTAVSQRAACVPTLKSTDYLLCFSPTRSLSPLKNVVRRIKSKASSSSSASVRSVPATAGQIEFSERKKIQDYPSSLWLSLLTRPLTPLVSVLMLSYSPRIICLFLNPRRLHPFTQRIASIEIT